MAAIQEVQNVEVLPLNAPSQATYGFKNGFPTISFQISSRAAFLDGKSVRLNGDVQLMQSNGNPVNNNKQVPGLAVFNTTLDSRVGIASAIQQVTISSASNGQTLEQVRQYPRWLISSHQTTASQEDLDSNMSIGGLTSSRSINGAVRYNNKLGFSIPLRTGFFSGGETINLSETGVHGLIVTLEMSPDFNLLSPYYLNSGTYVPDTAGAGTDTASGAHYQLSDLSLSFDALIPNEEGVNQMLSTPESAVQYNQVSHIYSVLNSSDQTQNLNLGTSKTLAVYHNTIPSNFINNPDRNSTATYRLHNDTANNGTFAGVLQPREISFAKGGILFPRDNRINTAPVRWDENVRQLPQTEKDIVGIDAIKPYNAFNHCLMSMKTNQGIANAPQYVPGRTIAKNGALYQLTNDIGSRRYEGAMPDTVHCEVMGVREDPFKVGVNFENTNYSVRVISDLDGKSPNAMFSYVLAQNTMITTPNGISVSS